MNRRIHFLSTAFGIGAGFVPLVIAAKYLFEQLSPDRPQYSVQLLPLGWVILRIVHFAILGGSETYVASRFGPTRAGMMTALALLITYQGVLAWLTVSYRESWMVYAGLGALIAAALALVESRGATPRTLAAFVATIAAGVGLLALYGAFPSFALSFSWTIGSL